MRQFVVLPELSVKTLTSFALDEGRRNPIIERTQIEVVWIPIPNSIQHSVSSNRPAECDVIHSQIRNRIGLETAAPLADKHDSAERGRADNLKEKIEQVIDRYLVGHRPDWIRMHAGTGNCPLSGSQRPFRTR